MLYVVKSESETLLCPPLPEIIDMASRPHFGLDLGLTVVGFSLMKY